MKLIDAVNRINSELSYIQSRHQHLMKGTKVDLFNSVVTVLAENLAKSITFSIRDRQKNQDIVKWSYLIQDENNVQRTGPSIHDIISVINQSSQSIYLDCQPKWSDKFYSMDSHRRAKSLQGSIWAKNMIDIQRTELFQDAHALPPSRKVDLHDIEDDLLKLMSENANLIDEQRVRAVLDSTRKMFSKKYISGINITLTTSRRDSLSWKYLLQSDGSLVREGKSIEQIIAIIRALKKRPRLIIKPITTPQFHQLSPRDQSIAMRGTIWASRPRSKHLLPW